MQRYEKYKDSGVEWIGEIPVGWEVKKLKRLSTIKRGASPRPIADPKYFDDFGEWAWVRISDVSASERYLENTIQTLSKLGASLSVKMFPNSFFLSIAGTVGKPIITKIQCCIHDGFVYFPSLNLNPEFLYYIFSTAQPYKGLGKLGTQLNLNTDTVGDISVPIPSAKTIESIINYLDRKTAEIDQLIAQKERLVALYEEEKTALINQAVTQGINPKATLKESGIDWLGEIPEGWEVKRLKFFISKAGSGVTPRGGASVYQLSGIPLLRSQNICFDGLKLDNVAYISQEIHDEMLNSQVFNGDVLLNITGASIGRCYFVIESLGVANVNQHVCILRPMKNILTKFLYFILRSNLGQEQINIEQTGSGREGLNFEVLKSFLIPSIKLDEQTAIVQHIETETARINAKIIQTQKIIALQKEYRTALISEVVTGKVKVT